MRRKIVNMKSNAKSKTIILIALGIIFALFPIFTINRSIITGITNKSSDYGDVINLDKENLKLSAVSGKIHIDGNSGWAAFRSAGNCTGNGTYSEPYVIEDLVIDGGGTGCCILIENSDVYFKIENCNLSNSGGYPNAGIRLSYVKNSQLINNNCSTNVYSGIFLQYSDNNTISDNFAKNNRYGIYLWNSKDNTISGNEMLEYGFRIYGDLETLLSNNIDLTNLVNGKPLFYYANAVSLKPNNFLNAGQVILVNCSDSRISNLNISYSSRGISLHYCNKNNISGNIFNKNILDGIYLRESSNNTISGNIANTNEYGFSLGGNFNTISGNIATDNNIGFSIRGDYTVFSENTANNNAVNGITFEGYNINISGNTANYNEYYGIRLSNSQINTIKGNTANYNDYGIYLTGCDKNNISGNTVSNNRYGIKLGSYNSDNNIISENIAINNVYGIYLSESDYNNISGNTADSNVYGICLDRCRYNDVYENIVNFNFYGIWLSDEDYYWDEDPIGSSYNTITGNFVINNSIGIYLYQSNYNDVSGNTVSNNDRGFSLFWSDNNDINGNSVNRNSEYGIKLERSNGNSIIMNIITNNSVGIYLIYCDFNEISSNTFSGNEVDIKDGAIEDFLWIVMPLIILGIIIALVIIGTIIRKKIGVGKSRLPKDEAVRYEITQELERKGISVSDHEKYNEIEWRYCKTCKKIVEPNLLLKAQRKLAKRSGSKKINFLFLAGNQSCPHCSKRLIPKELRRFRYYFVFAFCFWVTWVVIIFLNVPERYAEIIGGISFLGLLIGFGLYSKLILNPRLKKKMQLE